MSSSLLDQLLDERDVSRLLKMSLASIRRWRVSGRGPAYLKIGTSVRYTPQSVSEFLKSCISGGENASA
jgi:predicted DNA-binding transcriptional regulator AlpA